MTAVQEIELFMHEADKSNRTFFPKSVLSISQRFALFTLSRADFSTSLFQRAKPSATSFLQILFYVALLLMAACRAGPSEYQGPMNALKRKMDDGNQLLNQEMQAHKQETQALRKETKKMDDGNQLLNQEMQALKQETQALRKETQALKQELQGQLAEVIEMLRSKP